MQWSYDAAVGAVTLDCFCYRDPGAQRGKGQKARRCQFPLCGPGQWATDHRFYKQLEDGMIAIERAQKQGANRLLLLPPEYV